MQPYLLFEGRCEEALDCYKTALGAEVTILMRLEDNPEQPENCSTSSENSPTPTDTENKVMHTSFCIGDTDLMASDGRCSIQVTHQGFALSVTPADEAEAQRLFYKPYRWRSGSNATCKNILLTTIWHGRRSFWRVMDD